MSKALEDKSDPYLAILEYQNTPIDDGHNSPAELLMSCQLCSILLVIFITMQTKKSALFVVWIQQTKETRIS